MGPGERRTTTTPSPLTHTLKGRGKCAGDGIREIFAELSKRIVGFFFGHGGGRAVTGQKRESLRQRQQPLPYALQMEGVERGRVRPPDAPGEQSVPDKGAVRRPVADPSRRVPRG